MSDSFDKMLKRKKRSSGKPRDFVTSHPKKVSEIVQQPEVEAAAPVIPRQHSTFLGNILGEAHQGGPDYVSQQKRNEERRKAEEYNRRHERPVARFMAPPPPPGPPAPPAPQPPAPTTTPQSPPPVKAPSTPQPPVPTTASAPQPPAPTTTQPSVPTTAPAPQPPVSAISPALQNIDVLRDMNQKLKKKAASKEAPSSGDSKETSSSGNSKKAASSGNQNEYNPEDPLLSESAPAASSMVSSRVKFCDHYDFYIDWNSSDPDNRQGSWNPRKEPFFYTAADRDDHTKCGSPDLIRSSRILAERILQKFKVMEEAKLSKKDREKHGKEPRRLPSPSLVEREARTMMLQMDKHKTDKLVEKREQATGMDTNEEGKFVQGNALSGFEPGNNEFSGLSKPDRVTKDPKNQQKPASMWSFNPSQPKITKKRVGKAVVTPKPAPKPTPKPTSKAAPKSNAKAKAQELTAEERAILSKMKRTGAAELKKTVKAERKAKANETKDVESLFSEDEVHNFPLGSQTAPKSPKKTPAKKPSGKKVEKGATDLHSVEDGKRRLSTSSAVSRKSDSSDGLSQAINGALDAQSSQDPPKKPTIKMKKRPGKLPEPDSSDSSDDAPPPRLKKASTRSIPTKKRPTKVLETHDNDSDTSATKTPPKPINEGKRKASHVENENDQPQKKVRKEYKSTPIITESDEEAGDELISITSQMSDEDAVAIKESLKTDALEKTTTATKVTKVTETIESTTTIEPFASPKKRKLGDDKTTTTTDTVAPSPKKAKLTLDTSEETITPRSPSRSPRKKSSSPLLSPFPTLSQRKTLAEQEDEGALSPLSQPRNAPHREPEHSTPLTFPKTSSSKPEQTSPPSSPQSTGSTCSKKRKSLTNEEDKPEDTISPPQKKVKFTEDTVSPTQKRKMSIEFITEEKVDEVMEDADQEKVVDGTTEATGELEPPLAIEPDAGQDDSAEVNDDRPLDTFSEPDSNDSLWNE